MSKSLFYFLWIILGDTLVIYKVQMKMFHNEPLRRSFDVHSNIIAKKSMKP